MASLEMYSVTITPETARKVYKSLRKAGFIIEGAMTDATGAKSPRIYFSKNKVLSKKDKMEPFEVTKLGVYRKTISLMVHLVLEESEQVELNDIFKNLKIKGLHLGTDGGWLGFPYVLIYSEEELPELIKRIETGIKENDQYFDDLTRRYGFNYDQEVRDGQITMAQKLVSDLQKKIKD